MFPVSLFACRCVVVVAGGRRGSGAAYPVLWSICVVFSVALAVLFVGIWRERNQLSVFHVVCFCLFVFSASFKLQLHNSHYHSVDNGSFQREGE